MNALAARSTSSSTIAADLPPSSSETRFSRSVASDPTRRPAAVDPVNDTLSTPGVGDEVFADRAVGRHHREHAFGQAGFDEQRAEHQRVDRGLGRGLEHHRAPGEQRRHELVDGDEQRHVPRDDRGDDADRLAPHHALPEQPGAGLLPRESWSPARCTRRVPRSPGVYIIISTVAPGAPISSVSTVLNSGSRSVSSSVNRAMTLARSTGEVVGHGPWSNARRAAATAASMSASTPSGVEPTTSRVAGERTSKRLVGGRVQPTRHRSEADRNSVIAIPSPIRPNVI